VSSTQGGEASSVILDQAQTAWWSRPWFPVALAAGIALLVLVWLYIPGVLVFPQWPQTVPATGVMADERQIALQREHNQALRKQIEAARKLLDGKVCVQDGALHLPKSGGESGQDALRPVKPEEGGWLMPRAPEDIRARAALPSEPAIEGTLTEVLDKATVLVIVPEKGLGTGFFVSPDKLITNRHVVAEASSGVFVTNKILGSAVPARVVAMSEQSPDTGGPDFAMLQIETQRHAPVLAITSKVARLQRVIAAGFPGIITKADEKFDELMHGDPSAMPEMALTTGSITVIQNRATGLPIIGHEAHIAPGSSGGPLVDECARIVGVNTFGLFDETGRHYVNYALAAETLIQFLRSNGLSSTVSDDVCQAKPPVGASASEPSAPQASAPPRTQGEVRK
jgi:S1-C subfamily serine protease